MKFSKILTFTKVKWKMNNLEVASPLKIGDEMEWKENKNDKTKNVRWFKTHVAIKMLQMKLNTK
jgi:hypothetical protein